MGWAGGGGAGTGAVETTGEVPEETNEREESNAPML